MLDEVIDVVHEAQGKVLSHTPWPDVRRMHSGTRNPLIELHHLRVGEEGGEGGKEREGGERRREEGEGEGREIGREGRRGRREGERKEGEG